MPLSQSEAVAQTKMMLDWRSREIPRLDSIRAYVTNKQRTSWLPTSPPAEVRRLEKMARTPVLGLIVTSVVESMYVDGYRSAKSENEGPAWEVWQANKLDARQIGVHRAGISYDFAYVTVMPGDTAPVIKGVSPRHMTAVYGEDEDWPIWALEQRRSAVKGQHLYRLFDDTHVYWTSVDDGGTVQYISDEEHGVGRVPVVRFVGKEDLDYDDLQFTIEELMQLQDQINLTTFGLLVVQHYGAFPHRFISGWTPDATDKEEMAKAGQPNRYTYFDNADTKVFELQGANLQGYIDSRRDAMRNMAAISQTPAHELRGELINLSAEALAAAEAAERRKTTMYQTGFGESWEQVLGLAAEIGGLEDDPASQVRWKDTESRSFAATVDALGKLAQMVGVPVEMIFEMIPGWTQQQVERAARLVRENDSFAELTALLKRGDTEA